MVHLVTYRFYIFKPPCPFSQYLNFLWYPCGKISRFYFFPIGATAGDVVTACVVMSEGGVVEEVVDTGL